MSLKTVYLISFLDAFKFALVLPVINPHLMGLGGSFMLTGILQSSVAGMELFSSPIIGSLSDTHGRKLLLLCTIFIAILGNTIAGIDSIPLFFLGRILYGATHHTDPLIKASISDIFPDKETQTKAFNNLIALPGLAFITAPIIGGILYQQFKTFAILSSVLCSIDLVLIALVFMYIPYVKIEKKDEKQKSGNWKKYVDLLAIKFAVEVTYHLFIANSGLVFAKKYSFTSTQIGLYIAYMSITMMIGAILTPRINKRFYTSDTLGFKRMTHAVFSMVGCFTILVMIDNPILHLVLFVPASLAKLMLEVSWMEALTARTDESEKGLVMGLATSMLSAAGLVCPLISGALASYIGINVLTSLPLLPSIIGVLLTNRIQKQHVN